MSDPTPVDDVAAADAPAPVDAEPSAPQEEPEIVDQRPQDVTPDNDNPEYAPYISFCLENRLCDTRQADQWQRDLVESDTTATTWFGVDATSLSAMFFDPNNSAAAFAQAQQQVYDELAPGLYDPTTGGLLATPAEMTKLLSAGLLKCRARWHTQADPYPHIEQVHVTLRGNWSHPYVPEMQLSVIIDEEHVSNPNLWRCSGKLGGGRGVVRLDASYNPQDKMLILTYAEDSTIEIVHECAEWLQRVIEGGKLEGTGMMGKNDLLVAQRAMDPSVLPMLATMSNSRPIIEAAQRRLCVQQAKKDIDSLRVALRQFTPDEGGKAPTSHFEMKDVMKNMARLRLASPEDALLSKVAVNTDNTALLDRLREILRRNQGRTPKSGGARSAWLAKIHFLDIALYNSASDKKGLLDKTQQDYYSWLLTQMHQPSHPANSDPGRWRRIEAKIDMLTDLMQHREDDQTEVPPALPAEQVEEVSPATLQVAAEKELHDRHDDVMGGDVDESLPEAPVDDEGTEYEDDVDRLESLIRANPRLVPTSLQPMGDDEDDGAAVVNGDREAQALQLLDSTVSARHSRSHPGFKSVQRSISSKEGVGMEAAGRILGAANAKYKRKTGHVPGHTSGVRKYKGVGVQDDESVCHGRVRK